MARPAPANDGHKDTFGPPSKAGGWPVFDKHGKRVREEGDDEQVQER